MRVNFFAEYPGEGELQQAELIDFPSRIFLAAESLADYRDYRADLAAVNPDLEAAYWPILEHSYWVSPFADPAELDALFAATADLDDPVLLDLELPVGQPRQFLSNARSARANRRRIREFLRGADVDVVAAEYPPVPVGRHLFGPLGVRYPTDSLGHTRCPMFYSSVIPDAVVDRTAAAVEAMVESDEDVVVGLGTIATGAFEDEPILPPADLERDLARMAEAGADEVIIFRLGGLDEDYLDVIEPFVD